MSAQDKLLKVAKRVHDLIESLYEHDEKGNRTDFNPTPETAEGVVNHLANMEQEVAQAITLAEEED